MPMFYHRDKSKQEFFSEIFNPTNSVNSNVLVCMSVAISSNQQNACACSLVWPALGVLDRLQESKIIAYLSMRV